MKRFLSLVTVIAIGIGMLLANSLPVGADAVSEGTFASVDGVPYDSFDEALESTEAGSILKLHKDIAADSVLLGDGVTLDLNGYTLKAPGGLVSFGGQLLDSTDGQGLLVSDADSVFLAEDNEQLPLRDTKARGYRFFDYRFESLGAYTESKTNVAVFGMRLILTNDNGYTLLEKAGIDVTLKVILRWKGMQTQPLEYSFSSSLLKRYAGHIQNNDAYALLLRVSGAEGMSLTAEPYFMTYCGTKGAASAINHRVHDPNGELPGILTYLAYEALSLEEKQAYLDAVFHGDTQAFILWYNEAKAEYEASTDPPPTSSGDEFDVGQMND